MDRKTAASIRAQRDLALRLGGCPTEMWPQAYEGDVLVFIRGVLVAFEVVASDWGVWWSDAWDAAPDDRVVYCYSGDGLRLRGWTTVGEVRQAPVAVDAPLPNRLVRVSDLHRGLGDQGTLW